VPVRGPADAARWGPCAVGMPELDLIEVVRGRGLVMMREFELWMAVWTALEGDGFGCEIVRPGSPGGD